MAGTEIHQEAYVEFIKSCYRAHPASFAYYDRLIDYLRQTSYHPQSSLQAPRTFDASGPCQSDIYPIPFPFKVTNAEETKTNSHPRVIVLEGFPSPACIVSLGTKWYIRPEFFIGHLNPVTQGRLYESPTLLSLQDNLVRVRYISLIKSLVDRPKSFLIKKHRSEMNNTCLRQEKGLLTDRKYGASRFRRINLHDSQMCSVEQTVSMTVVGDPAHWNAVFLTDQGRRPIVHQGMPWKEYNSNERPIGTLVLVPYNDTLAKPHSSPGSDADLDFQSSLDEFHPLKNAGVKDEIDHKLLLADPFYLLYGLLRTSLLSWTQLLNYLAACIEESNNQLDLDQNELRFHLEQLRFHVTVIHQTKDHFSESLQLIIQGGCASWPKSTDSALQERKRLLQQQLEADCRHLLERCSLMANKCESAIEVLVGFSQLVTAERGISQAEEVQSLTKLASVFVPLSFVTSIFGMNILEWQPAVSIVWFVLLAVLFIALSFLFLYRRCCKYYTSIAYEKFERMRAP
ncbi:hypothetical protein F5B20DRAFT_522428 [Whalleya microplaca]|nr:hypothetical protein F5B20DRAFT_522428 [Whalleya microplaca]